MEKKEFSLYFSCMLVKAYRIFAVEKRKQETIPKIQKKNRKNKNNKTGSHETHTHTQQIVL